MFKKIVAVAVAAFALTGCVSADNSAHVPVVMDAVVRATDEMSVGMDGSFMTGAFMTLTNDTGHDLTLVGGKSDIAPMVEIHEVVNGMMQKKEGGLLIKAGEQAVLKPGGNHVMLMGMTSELTAGSEVKITLIFDDESELEVVAPVKVVNLEQEHYHSESPSPMSSGM